MIFISNGNDTPLFREKYRVASVRLKDWDYSSCGYYYITICTKEKQCWFGDVVEMEGEPGATIRLSSVGKIIDECWFEIPEHYENVELDMHVVMPNHIHGIVIIEGDGPENFNMNHVETRHAASLRKRDLHLQPCSLGSIINQYKSACSKNIHRNGYDSFTWQSRFHDHIIRNEKDLERIRTYMYNNPIQWLVGEDDDA